MKTALTHLHVVRPWLALVPRLLLIGAAAGRETAPAAALDAYNVVWRTPSHDGCGSMPIGNREAGLTV